MDANVAGRTGRRSVALSALIVIAGVLTVLLLSLRPASAQTVSAYPPPPPSSSSSFSSGSDSAADTTPQIVTRPLASTGSDSALLIYVGGALVVLGGLAVYASRRRTN
jgi:LPXTG-motif cell wall-anchored protein